MKEHRQYDDYETRLMIIVPCTERGKNGRLSFSRELYNAILFENNIETKNAIQAAFKDNKNGIAYLTVHGIKALENVGAILNPIPFSIDNYNHVNGGLNGESAVIKHLNKFGYKFVKTNQETDKNGIDFFSDLLKIRVQLKTCCHGLTEKINYLDTDKKRYGISVINGNVQTLLDIIG